MTDLNENTIHQRIDEFFKSPNGAQFYAVNPNTGRGLCAVKMPLGDSERFSAVITESIWYTQPNDPGLYPDDDWKFTLDSYVDNETGRRLIDGYSEFESVFEYKDGMKRSAAHAEVTLGVQEAISAMSNDELMLSALTASINPAPALTFSEDEKKRVIQECRSAFVFDQEPESSFRLKPNFDLREVLTDLYGYQNQTAKFSLSYLSDKDTFISTLVDRLAPKLARDVLHSRVFHAEVENHLAQLRENPPAELLKEQAIRKAIEDKASIWVTFGKGSETLRISVPTDAFRTADNALNKYALPNKDQKRLEDFLADPDHRGWRWDVHISDIVALDFKGKTMYRDEAFYDGHRTQDNHSFDSVLKNAQNRATAQQKGAGTAKEPIR